MAPGIYCSVAASESLRARPLSAEAVGQFQLQPFRQPRIDGVELRQGPLTLLRLQQAQISQGQLHAALIQLPIHVASAAIGCKRLARPAASGHGQISS